MADKAISELTSAAQVTPLDLFVLEQNGSAKKLTGQVLENWLVSMANGHGGIHDIQKKSTAGLKDTYTITLADTTTFDFIVTNGRSITSFTKTGTSGLNDTYRISYNDGTSTTITVTNGAKGDKGDNSYVHIKWAYHMPTASSHTIGDIPDNWIGIYTGNAASAPTDWQAYTWYQYKGEKGDKGDPATVANTAVEYQVSESGTIYPSGAWQTTVPFVPQGEYLWTRTTVKFNSGNPLVAYSVSRMGLDGAGSVSMVCGISPDPNGNVHITAADVDALPIDGGNMMGPIHMSGQVLDGLNDPTDDTQPATKSYTDKMLPKSGGAMEGNINMDGNVVTGLGDPVNNSDAVSKGYVDDAIKGAIVTLPATGWANNRQTVTVKGVPEDGPDNAVIVTPAPASITAWSENGVKCAEQSVNMLTFSCESVPDAALTVHISIFMLGGVSA